MKKGFARAQLVRVVTPSALRRAAPCPIAEECGGCDWTALRLDAQLLAKKRILTESLRRIGKMNAHPPITIHPSPLNYRLRSRLHRDGDAIGFYAMGSHRVVPLAPECEVVGIETARNPMEGSTWEIDGHVVRGDQEQTIRVDQFTYRLSTASFFQVNRHLLRGRSVVVSGARRAKILAGARCVWSRHAPLGRERPALRRRFTSPPTPSGRREGLR